MDIETNSTQRSWLADTKSIRYLVFGRGYGDVLSSIFYVVIKEVFTYYEGKGLTRLSLGQSGRASSNEVKAKRLGYKSDIQWPTIGVDRNMIRGKSIGMKSDILLDGW